MPKDFMALTPGEFMLMWKGFLRRQEMDNRRAAMMCAAVMNAATMQVNIQLKPKDRIKKEYSPDDFLGKPDKQKKKKPKQQTPEQMLATVRMLHSAFGGK